MRGGLDDALDKLARRDELRRRVAGEAIGTPPAVHELVEAIAAVVGRNPKLEVTVGVEGVGDPTLLHFYVQEGVVQVNADSSVASRVTEAAPTSPRHADFDIDLDDPIGESTVTTASPGPAHAAPAAYAPASDVGQQTRRISYDDRDRYDPGTGYGTTPFGEPDPYSRPEPSYDTSRHAGRESAPVDDSVVGDDRYRSPFAATPPPHVPLQTPQVPQTPHVPPQTPRRIRPEHHRAPEEPSAAERSRTADRHRAAEPERRAGEGHRTTDRNGHTGHNRHIDLNGHVDHTGATDHNGSAHRNGSADLDWSEPERGRVGAHQHAASAARGMPTPLPEPIPLHVDSAETEMAAKRLAALLRDNPSLLRPAPPTDNR